MERITMRMNDQNCIVMPQAIREMLGVSAGDEISFLPDTRGSVRVMATRTLHRDTRAAVWANNQGGDNSTVDIRVQRRIDHEVDAASQAEMDAERDDRSAEQITHDLLAQLI